MHPLPLAIQLARAAGAYQRQRFGGPKVVTMKGLVDPVTDVDQACERLIIEGIRQHFPEHDVVAEEGSGGPLHGGGWRWIVDPLDGTVNYTHGYPLFCVCIALYEAGRPVFGVIYEPNREELFVAQRGAGATCNDRPIHVSRQQHLIESLLATGFAYGRDRGDLALNIPVFNDLLWRTRAIRRDGVAGVDLAYVACGRFDGFWEYYLKPWDVAAGAILVTEAGGVVTGCDGQAFDPSADEIVATNGRLHDALVAAIRDRQPGPVRRGAT